MMSYRGELDDAQEADASPLHAELVPRIAGAALSVAALTSPAHRIYAGLNLKF